MKKNHPRKRWVFLPIACQFCPRLAEVRSWLENSFENPHFSSGHLEGSFVNNNVKVAAISQETFRRKSKFLLKIRKKLEEKNSRES